MTKLSKSAKAQQEQKGTLNSINETLKEIATLTDEVKQTETETEPLTLMQILAISDANERNLLLAKLQEQEAENSLVKSSEAVHDAFLKGANILGLKIYNNSIKMLPTTTKTLFNLSRSLKDATGKIDAMTPNAFSRSFNTSLFTLTKNIKYNSEHKNDANFSRKNYTLDYFMNINERMQGIKGKTVGNKKFQQIFKDFVNADGIVKQSLTILITTTETDKNEKVFPFGNMNNIFVYNKDEADKSLELLKCWLIYSGANEDDFNL